MLKSKWINCEPAWLTERTELSKMFLDFWCMKFVLSWMSLFRIIFSFLILMVQWREGRGKETKGDEGRGGKGRGGEGKGGEGGGREGKGGEGRGREGKGGDGRGRGRGREGRRVEGREQGILGISQLMALYLNYNDFLSTAIFLKPKNLSLPKKSM